METMEHPIRNRISEKGRVVVPAPIREVLGIGVGDAFDWRVEDGEVRISTIRNRDSARAQERATPTSRRELWFPTN
jgi:AbrB family looped-hinge helix DNA binding protein